MQGEKYLLSLLSGPDKKDDNTEEMNVYHRNIPFIKFFKDKLTVKYTGKGTNYSHITVNIFIFFYKLS